MKKSRFSEEQSIGFIKEAEAGMPVAQLCRKHGFNDASFYKWRTKFGGMDIVATHSQYRFGCVLSSLVRKSGIVLLG